MQLWLNDWMDVVGSDRFIYTTQPYILSLYLDCHPGMGLHCPGEAAVAAVRAAIKRGAISWHAMPFNVSIFYLHVVNVPENKVASIQAAHPHRQ